MRIRLRENDISAIATFEKITRTGVVDYLDAGDTLYFVVDGRARISDVVGKDGANVKMVGKMLGKDVRVYRFGRTAKDYAKNLVGVKAKAATLVKKPDGTAFVRVSVDKAVKPLVMGRGKKNLAALKELLRRKFDVADLKIE